MEVHPVGAMLIHADKRMDMTTPAGAFHDYVNDYLSPCPSYEHVTYHIQQKIYPQCSCKSSKGQCS